MDKKKLKQTSVHPKSGPRSVKAVQLNGTHIFRLAHQSDADYVASFTSIELGNPVAK